MTPDTAFSGSGKARALIALALLTGVLSSALPTPLYPLYQAQFQLPAITMTAIFCAYVFGVLAALLIGGKLADRVADRRRILIPALSMVVLSAILMASAHSVAALLVARLFAGIGTGCLTGAGNAALLDLEPARTKQRAALLATVSFAAGGTLGPILSGLALQAGFFPTIAPFVILALLAAGTAIGLGRVPWPPSPPAPAVKTDTAPVAADARQFVRTMWLCCTALTVIWSFGAVTMALGPTFGERLLGIHDYALSGYAMSALTACAGLGQWLSRRTGARSAFQRGCFGLGAGLAMVIAALSFGIPSLMIPAIVMTGVGFGTAFMGAAGMVNHVAPHHRRAALISRFYIAGYIGNLIPMALGLLIDRTSHMLAAQFYLWVSLLAVAAFILLSDRLLGPGR